MSRRVKPGDLLLRGKFFTDNNKWARRVEGINGVCTKVQTSDGKKMLSPGVSDDNPYSESLFRTLKYRPEYPHKPFESIDADRRWMMEFVKWYNTQHLHSGIRFVTPEARHNGDDKEILRQRHLVYEKAKQENSNRWSEKIKNWDTIENVSLNPAKASAKKAA